LPEYAIAAGTLYGPPRQDTVAIPVFWIVLLLSAMLHAIALYVLPPLSFDLKPGGDPDVPMSVDLQPRLQPPPGLPVVPTPDARVNVAPPRAAAVPSPSQRRAQPPVPPASARAQPAPEVMTAPAQTARAVPDQVPTPSTEGRDFASLVESRRRARAESEPAPAPARAGAPADMQLEDEDARSKRVVAANLGLGQTPTFGGPPKHSGGVFHVTRLNYASAEFLFYGWNKDIRRNTSQLIEVRKGEHSDIKLAVIRRMIGIVREHESGDFRWESQRLGREVTLSARPGDNAGLEDFLMREFFGDPRG